MINLKHTRLWMKRPGPHIHPAFLFSCLSKLKPPTDAAGNQTHQFHGASVQAYKRAGVPMQGGLRGKQEAARSVSRRRSGGGKKKGSGKQQRARVMPHAFVSLRKRVQRISPVWAALERARVALIKCAAASGPNSGPAQRRRD